MKIRKSYWGRGHQDPLCTIETNGKNNCNFPNRQELLNAILDLKKKTQMFEM